MKLWILGKMGDEPGISFECISPMLVRAESEERAKALAIEYWTPQFDDKWVAAQTRSSAFDPTCIGEGDGPEAVLIAAYGYD